MAIIYYYVKKDNTDSFLKFGIKLSENYSSEININGYIKQCFLGLLNPKDDEYKFNSDEYDCLKIDINTDNCNVIDNSSFDGEIKHLHPISLKKYTFGDFKNPQVVITTSILPEHISILNKDIDCPVLFDNSRDLFYQSKAQRILDEISPKEAYLALRNYIDDKYWFLYCFVLLLQRL